MQKRIPQRQWNEIKAFLERHSRVYVGQEADCRRFISAIQWISRTGSQWRALPERYGKWNSIYQRFRRWCAKGVWSDMLRHFANEPDLEWLLVDSSIVRAHPCAAGAPKKRGRKRRML